jgi:hypothetical protein
MPITTTYPNCANCCPNIPTGCCAYYNMNATMTATISASTCAGVPNGTYTLTFSSSLPSPITGLGSAWYVQFSSGGHTITIAVVCLFLRIAIYCDSSLIDNPFPDCASKTATLSFSATGGCCPALGTATMVLGNFS